MKSLFNDISDEVLSYVNKMKALNPNIFNRPLPSSDSLAELIKNFIAAIKAKFPSVKLVNSNFIKGILAVWYNESSFGSYTRELGSLSYFFSDGANGKRSYNHSNGNIPAGTFLKRIYTNMPDSDLSLLNGNYLSESQMTGFIKRYPEISRADFNVFRGGGLNQITWRNIYSSTYGKIFNVDDKSLSAQDFDKKVSDPVNSTQAHLLFLILTGLKSDHVSLNTFDSPDLLKAVASANYNGLFTLDKKVLDNNNYAKLAYDRFNNLTLPSINVTESLGYSTSVKSLDSLIPGFSTKVINWPTPYSSANITSGYLNPRANHPAYDFSKGSPVPIGAFAPGSISEVLHIPNNSGYGNLVRVSHMDGFSTLYAHLSEVKVKVGQKVNQGDIIGLEGNTGISSGSHLHFELLTDQKSYINQGKNIDVKPYIGKPWIDLFPSISKIEEVIKSQNGLQNESVNTNDLTQETKALTTSDGEIDLHGLNPQSKAQFNLLLNRIKHHLISTNDIENQYKIRSVLKLERIINDGNDDKHASNNKSSPKLNKTIKDNDENNFKNLLT